MNKQYFIDAAALVRNGFCTGAYSRNNIGVMVTVDNPEATCYCMLGAFKKVVAHYPMEKRDDLNPYYNLMWTYAHDLCGEGITQLNDNPFYTPDAEAAAKHLEAIAALCP